MRFWNSLMFATTDPDMIVAWYAIGGLVLVGLWRLFSWLWSLPVTPDPWDSEIEQRLQDAQEVCPHCATLQPPDAWFCARCDNPVGPYHSFTPYIYQFSTGEVFRDDGSGEIRANKLVAAGYVLLSISRLGLLAPLYWIAFARNQQRLKDERLQKVKETSVSIL